MLLPSLLLLGGCGPDFSPPGPERTETRSVDLDSSEEVRAELTDGRGRTAGSRGRRQVDGSEVYL